MITKNFLLLLLLLFLICGCTTVEFVRKDLTPTKQAILRYSPPSSAKSEAEYREEVKKQATEFCGGDFQITKEYQAREESGSSAGAGTGFSMGSGTIFLGGSNRNTSMYNFVEVACNTR